MPSMTTLIEGGQPGFAHAAAPASTIQPPLALDAATAAATAALFPELLAVPGADCGVDPFSGRIHMSCPTMPRASVARKSTARKADKHRRLFDGASGALQDGQKVTYINGGVKCLTGAIVIKGKTHGILCDCCGKVVSCSAFEGHAGHGTRRNPYDGITTEDGLTLRFIAANLPPLPDDYVAAPAPSTSAAVGRSKWKKKSSSWMQPLVSIVDRCNNIMGQLDTLGSSCVICYQTDFDKEGFSDRTVIICDQCEREFHVGCLREEGRCHLTAVPDGDWFCCGACSSIRQSLTELVAAGEAPCCSSDRDYTWTVMRGKGSGDASAKALKEVQSVLQESFDPIIDVTSQQDLLPKMIHASTVGEFDFQGMFSILLKHKGKSVCAGLLRIFGTHLAELPLVATRANARRQGHCRVLMAAIESRLYDLNVAVLSLPAATAAIPTWINSFHFRRVAQHDLQALSSELRLLMFPGSQILYKETAPTPPGGPWAFCAHPGQGQECTGVGGDTGEVISIDDDSNGPSAATAFEAAAGSAPAAPAPAGLEPAAAESAECDTAPAPAAAAQPAAAQPAAAQPAAAAPLPPPSATPSAPPEPAAHACGDGKRGSANLSAEIQTSLQLAVALPECGKLPLSADLGLGPAPMMVDT
ncbi:hypothetical protein FOA52_008460 [Chlamydomonas sp. UWO 241]|nr:hypothetical protein FOA52_008460 [Chlamydomonas sp. UWO 241]